MIYNDCDYILSYLKVTQFIHSYILKMINVGDAFYEPYEYPTLEFLTAWLFTDNVRVHDATH